MDGNFSFKRKANNKIQEYREGIFAPTRAEVAMHGSKEEVDHFDKKADESEAKEEAVSNHIDILDRLVDKLIIISVWWTKPTAISQQAPTAVARRETDLMRMASLR